MTPEFRKDVILHIEDEPFWREFVGRAVSGSMEAKEAYGGAFAYVESTVRDEVLPGVLEAELDRIAREMGLSPAVVGVVTAQVARGFLERYLPGVTISDTSFPLNGKKVVEWIRAHGFEDYALIGLSGTDFRMLDPGLQAWFGCSNARYFLKGCALVDQPDELIAQVMRNREDNARRYSLR